MNNAADIFSYAKTHDINLIAEDGQLKIDAPETALTNDFLSSAKQHKMELINVLQERWNPELAEKGYVLCLDCQHLDNVCTHPDNPFKKQCIQVPKKCRWHEGVAGNC